jgi:hypothetical protein
LSRTWLADSMIDMAVRTRPRLAGGVARVVSA